MKKFLSLLLCLILLFGLLPMTAPARADSSGDWEYESDCNNPEGVTITRYRGKGGNVTIPSTLGRSPVTGIDSSVFSNCKLTSVSIPASVTSIGETFFGFSDLQSINVASENNSYCSIDGVLFNKAKTVLVAYPGGRSGDYSIPAGVIDIGAWAFYYCADLTGVTIPKSVTRIDYEAFTGCTGLERVNISDLAAWCAISFSSSDLDASTNPLEYAHVLYLNGKAVTKLTIPSGVTRVKDYAFSGCSTLKSAVIPEGVESIGNRAFSDCSGLTNVTIPSTVTRIGYGAFQGCGLTRVNISDLAAWCAIEFAGNGNYNNYTNPLTQAHALYLNGAEIKDLTIPAGVTEIKNYTFSGANGLTSVTIPEGGTAIGDYAFCNCSNLSGVVIPEGVTGIGRYTFSSCSKLTSVTIPKSVTAIGDYAFSGCYQLTSVKIPSGVKRIGEGAFSGCSLKSVTIPKSVKTIGTGVFGMYSDSVTVGPTGSGCDIRYGWTTSIPKNSFSGCYSLRTAVIPATVTEIRENAFADCSNLQQVHFGGTAEQWDEILLFGGNEALQNAKLFFGYQTGDPIFIDSGSCGDDLTYTLDQKGKLTISGTGKINSSAFMGMGVFNYSDEIRSVVISRGVTEIGNDAFSDCTNLTSVTIPDSVSTIGNGAFQCCTRLTSITIPDSVTTIGPGAFNLCEGLTSVTLSNSITSINDDAFNCTSLTSIVIPKGVTSISDSAFCGCASLTDVYYGGTAEDWDRINIEYSNEPLTSANIHFTEPLTITGLKANKTGAAPGTAITWTATASGGSGTLKYYFILYKDGTQIATRSYSKTKTFSYTPTEAGTYKVKVYVKDEDGIKVHKTGAAVTIAVPPVITAQPSPKTVTSGKTAVFTVTASGTGLTYQWQYSKDGGNTWYNKSGATSASCSVTAKTSYNGFLYRCKVSNAGGTVYSNSAKLTVTAAKPVITTQPANQTVAAGETATFKVAASGTGLTYQWQYSKDGGTTWYNKTDANSTTYTVTAKTAYNGFRYRCRVKNEVGTVYSNPAELTVLPKPVVTTQPANQTVAAGATATFKVVASGTGLTYQWQYSKDGGTTWYNKTGATETSCTVTAKTSYDGFLYRCKVKNSAGTVYSNSAKLTVTAAKPVITTQPAAKTVTAGGTATFKVVASGTGLTYQWQYSKDGGTTWYNKTDANTTTYTVTAKASYDGFLYRCKVKNSAGTVYSSSAKLTVTSSAAPVISSVKADKTAAAAGTKITWTATASGGTGTLQYYFILYKDGTKVKTRSYSTTNTFSYTPTEPGTYKVRVYVKDAEGAKVNKLSAAVTVTG